jgi:5-methylthioadenosine/S-adenosylhomocysteine deaminase
MNESNQIIEDGAVVVANSTILAVGTRANMELQYPQAESKHFNDALLMPGLVNTHCHSGLLRGTAEGLAVWDWLQRYIDPMHRVITEKEAEIASRLCYAEALMSGTTTIVDMWRHMHGSAAVAKELGIRVNLVPYVAEHPDHNYFETLATNEALINSCHQTANDRIQVWVGLEHMFYATPDALMRITHMCRDYQVGFHTHSNESRFDVEKTIELHGVRPINVLEKLKLLETPKTLLAHCVWLDQKEIDLIANYGVGVAHNPVSNMKLASGAANVVEMLKAGIAVGLGTDGEKENNNLDMFEEMKTASLLAKFDNLDAAALDAWSVCRMATIEGARALGMDSKIGSLEVGKRADMVAIKTNTPRMTPYFSSGDHLNLHHNLVHAVQGGDVDMTMVDGNILVENGKLIVADLQEIIDSANQVAGPLLSRRDLWVKNSGASVNELDR